MDMINFMENDYEALPDHSPLYAHMMAGALAGISEHCLLFPVDSIKTRMQMLQTHKLYSGIFDAFSKTSIRSLWKGVLSVFIGAGPAHALYFATYEECRRRSFSPSISGAFATIITDAFMNPFDVVKQRMQAYSSPFSSIFECSATILRNEGISAFYVSYPITLFLSVPFHAIQFSVYESFSSYLNPQKTYSPLVHCLSGGVAGATAAALTTPLDVVKTVLQTSSFKKSTSSIPTAVHAVWIHGGFSGFFRGMIPRILLHMPSTAICWTSYEYFKYLFLSKHPIY